MWKSLVITLNSSTLRAGLFHSSLGFNLIRRRVNSSITYSVNIQGSIQISIQSNPALTLRVCRDLQRTAINLIKLRKSFICHKLVSQWIEIISHVMLQVHKYVYKYCELSLGSSNSRSRVPAANERRFILYGTSVFKRFNKTVQYIWNCAGCRFNIHTWRQSPCICHHKKIICFEIRNNEPRWTLCWLRIRTVNFSKCKKKKIHRK